MTGESVDDRTDPENAPTAEGGPEHVEPESATEEKSYGGLFGSYPYAFRQSDSLLFKTYAVVGGLLALLIALLFTFGLVGVIASTTGTGGGVFSFSRAFFIFVGLLVVFPLLAPVLSVARRHRRVGSNARYDAAIASAGYLFLLTLYLALLISTPPEQQQPVSGAYAPLVELFYALPAIVGLVPPVVGAAAIYATHRLTR
ncbi:hypothetical protein [Halorientalis regularis]|jgi:hypothetical protein|uniref:DUF8056 domain-containing protein n=1 Tax=Halorientalis regularis TaxID=660518 RepID=A0A1G7L9I8_9EURY|nr:hypothetical protein [Halorientalis regularis]SDF46115.1 hypothetical protein SAMN05216218_106212 [Halorientalis regularis]